MTVKFDLSPQKPLYPISTVARRCPPNVYIACRNAKDHVAVAGKSDNVAYFVQKLRSEGFSASPVHGIFSRQGQPNEMLFGRIPKYFSKRLKGKPIL